MDRRQNARDPKFVGDEQSIHRITVALIWNWNKSGYGDENDSNLLHHDPMFRLGSARTAPR